MRITNGILAREALTGLQKQWQELERARQQVTTGLRVEKASDDPVATTAIMESSSGLRALEQYRKNLETGQARLGVEDAALEQITNALTRALEVATSQAGDPATAATRTGAQAEIDGLIDFVTDLGNTKFAGSYLYGGQYADSPPFVNGLPDPARPAAGTRPVEVGAGVVVETNHSAEEIFLNSDVVDSLTALSTALGANDPAGVQAAMTRLDGAIQAVQELTGELGARMNQLDVTVANLDSLKVTLSSFRSDLRDADLNEAITELVNRQVSLEAAMMANSRIMDIALTDYL